MSNTGRNRHGSLAGDGAPAAARDMHTLVAHIRGQARARGCELPAGLDSLLDQACQLFDELDARPGHIPDALRPVVDMLVAESVADVDLDVLASRLEAAARTLFPAQDQEVDDAQRQARYRAGAQRAIAGALRQAGIEPRATQGTASVADFRVARRRVP